MSSILSFPKTRQKKPITEVQVLADFEEFIGGWKPTTMPTDDDVSRARTLLIKEFKKLGAEPFDEPDEEIRRALVRSQAYETWERELERWQSRNLL